MNQIKFAVPAVRSAISARRYVHPGAGPSIGDLTASKVPYNRRSRISTRKNMDAAMTVHLTVTSPKRL